MQTYLDSPEDLAWLAETHGVDTSKAACAILFGNEDCPSKVHTYRTQDYRQRPEVWLRDDAGNLKRGELPATGYMHCSHDHCFATIIGRPGDLCEDCRLEDIGNEDSSCDGCDHD
jgi:hypothetical protein